MLTIGDILFTFDSITPTGTSCIALPTGTSYIDLPCEFVGIVNSLEPFKVPNQEEGKTPMNYASAKITAGPSDEATQRHYLISRLDEVYYTQKDKLASTFHLHDDAPPKTGEEFLERIKAGKISFKDTKKTRAYYWADLVIWRDPEVSADNEGYEAAKKLLKDERKKTMDIIQIRSPEEGLEALQAFETWAP